MSAFRLYKSRTLEVYLFGSLSLTPSVTNMRYQKKLKNVVNFRSSFESFMLFSR